ncbi:MAG TPA: methyltransferase domain-containing protein [Jiangellaceae bacterium]
MTTTLDTLELEQRVKNMYEEVAHHPDRTFHFETGRKLAERLGYPATELDAIPAGAVDSFAGVGYFLDLAAIAPGETVLDLGSGSGMDSLLAARHAGESGRVIGIDMTDAQLDKARELATRAGTSNVEFRRGRIEDTDLDDASVDVVISNGVFNLAPDKSAVFTEIARVLRPGGRLALADIVTSEQLPEGVKCDASLWAACIGGAMQHDLYQKAIESAGLSIELGRANDYRFLSESASSATEKWGVRSVTLLAHKTEGSR